MDTNELTRWIAERKVQCSLCLGRGEDPFGDPCTLCKGFRMIAPVLLMAESDGGMSIAITDRNSQQVTVSREVFEKCKSLATWTMAPFAEVAGDTHG